MPRWANGSSKFGTSPTFPRSGRGRRATTSSSTVTLAQAIKTVDASLRVGGPATAMTAWIDELLAYCESRRLPVDFISTHLYPTDPLGFEGANTEEQLAKSPRNFMRDRTKLVRELSRERPVYFTEWNISSNPRDPLPRRVVRGSLRGKDRPRD